MPKNPTIINPIDASFEDLTKAVVMKNIAPSKTNKIKDLELKMTNNIAGFQTEIVFDVEIEKEVGGIQMGVLKGGTPYLTQEGLSKLCGVSRKMLYNIDQEMYTAKEGKAKDRADKIKELLKVQGYNEKDLFIRIQKAKNEVYNAYPDSVCMALLEYFAFDDSRKEAQANYRLLARSSFRTYIYGSVGYKYDATKLDKWKHFLDRVDINYDVVPEGYFSIFKETSGLTVSLIRNEIIIDENRIPDLSVGGTWGRYWSNNELDKEFGNRVKYNHNYPDYFPQSASNPQESWCYPNDALPLFRKWFRAEYIYSKFPAYLLSKVKQLKLTHEHKNKILEAVRPKEIENRAN